MYISHAYMKAASISLGIAFIFVLLRCYSRFFLTKSVGTDDFCVILGHLASVLLTFCLIKGRAYDVRHHDDDGSTDTITQELVKSLFGVIICYCVGTAAIKNSAILQCLRFILIGKMRTFCWSFLIFVTLSALTGLFLNVFHCHPIQAFWVTDIPGATCLDLNVYWFFVSAGILVTNIVVMAIPIYTVKGLNIPYRQKVALMAVFSMGGLACIAAIVRIYYLVKLSGYNDTTRSNYPAAIWCSLELNIEIICVCVPPLKPIFNKFAPSLLRSSVDGGNVLTNSSQLSGQTLIQCEEDNQKQPQQPLQRKDTLAFLDENTAKRPAVFTSPV